MANHIWSGFQKIAEAAVELSAQKVAEKVDKILNATMEAIADTLPMASASLLHDGSGRAKKALDTIAATTEIDRYSPNFIAGRLAAAAEVLGYAYARTADEAALALARRKPYATILVELSGGSKRNSDLAVSLGKSEEHICRLLRELREIDAVAGHKRGREVYNALTPVGRLLVQMGVEQSRRVALSETNVVSMSASERFDMRRLEPNIVQPGSSIPRISANSSH